MKISHAVVIRYPLDDGQSNQLLTPDELRGPVTSVNSMFTNTGPQLGQFEAGALASVIGAVGATALGGLVITSIAAGTAVVRSVRRFEVREIAPV